MLASFCTGLKKNIEVFLVHPGGSYWYKKEIGAWSIPKGEIEEFQDLFIAAIREMQEETGIDIHSPQKEFIRLKELMQNSGKKVLNLGCESRF
ncbi:MAG: NUDIX domain-containing protein [Ginsengibacter sp.]